jgi:aconitate hydratase
LPALLANKFSGGRQVQVRATTAEGHATEFSALVRIDTPQEIFYYEHGGILQFVLRQLLASKPKPETMTVG